MLFPFCVVTRAQSQKTDAHQTVYLSDSFLMPAFPKEVGCEETNCAAESSNAPVIEQEGATCPNTNSDCLLLPVSHGCLGAAVVENVLLLMALDRKLVHPNSHKKLSPDTTISLPLTSHTVWVSPIHQSNSHIRLQGQMHLCSHSQYICHQRQM